MKTCKVKPNKNQCLDCLDREIDKRTYPDCDNCKLCKEEYELIQVGTSLLRGDWAMICKNGKIEKVPLSMIFDVKEALLTAGMSPLL